MERARIPGLDGLRAVSIIFVLLGHLSGTVGYPAALRPLGELAVFGVRVFFVISGFLITSLLLSELDRTGAIALGRFYFRRTLRLFPAAYVYVVVLALLGASGTIVLLPHDLLHAVAYTTNYHFHRSWSVGHLWSLAVEEQFYLLWPALLLMLGRRRAAKSLIVVCLLEPIARVALWKFYPELSEYSGHLFFTIADILATGCLLAIYREELWAWAPYRKLVEAPFFWLVPVAGVIIYLLPFWLGQWLFGISAVNVIIAMTIDRVTRVTDDAVGRVLNARPLIFIGTLSYSLYLWQQLFLNRESFAWFNAFPQNFMLACVAGFLSYKLVESPALKLRTLLESSRGSGASREIASE